MAIPLLLAPILTKLAESGLNLIADAVTAKGKDVIEETLGVDLDKETQSPEGLLKLKQLEFDHQEFLIEAGIRQKEQELKEVELADKNTQGARDMNVKVQESSNASKLAKEAAYYIDFILIGATLGMAYIILFQSVPEANKEIFYTAFGSLLAMCSTILNFHRGTSMSSRNKDEHNKALVEMLNKGDSK